MTAEANVMVPKRHIYLIGFSGCGKSTVGPLLARELSREFVDTDSLVEARRRRTISDIFADGGEVAFRKLETDLLAEVAADASPKVIALGGGATTVPRNRHLIKSSGISVFLSCSIRELERRLRTADDRPLLVDAEDGVSLPSRQARFKRIGTLLGKRRAVYHQADLTVATTNRSPQQTVDMVIEKLRRKYAHG